MRRRSAGRRRCLIRCSDREGTWLFKPSKITLYVGAPIETVGRSNDEMLAIIARTHKLISDFAEHGLVPEA